MQETKQMFAQGKFWKLLVGMLSLLPVILFCVLQSGQRQESYRYAVTPGTEKKKKKKKGKEDLDDLKQELEMDEHKIPIEELYERLGTDPNSVSELLLVT